MAGILRHSILRLRIYGAENIPNSGPVLLVANHVSLFDMVMLQCICHNRVRFMVRADLLEFLPVRFVFWYLGVIRVPNAKHPKEMQAFFDKIKRRLKHGETLCLFPEGEISGNGNMMRFRSGVDPMMPENTEVTILPVRIGMLHGRLLTVEKGKAHFNWPKKLPVNYSITVGEPVEPNLSPFQLRQKISELGAITERLPQPGELPFHTSFVIRAKRHPFRSSFYDAATGAKLSNFKLLVGAMLLSRKILRLDRGENGYVGVLMPNCNAAAATLMAVLFADRTPAVINYSAGAQVALESARRAGVKTIFTSRKFLEKLKWEPTLEMVFLEDVSTIIT
ncbi:MAG: 1-acyl-sn-glycerol-3-phosphate acyltransferase, partial [Lentisphaeria bacterium]|nr:1-acyl-sn-glycerol-3-phosphate acyltransferase [Lentisphaeria bacterium]